MKYIIALLLVVSLFVSGCGITGMVVNEMEEAKDAEEKDLDSLNVALLERDVTVCYPIESQHVREQCFMQLAEELKDVKICRNLLGSLRETCKTVAQ